MAKTAWDIMTPDCQCVGENDSVLDAAKRLAELDVGSMPICGEDDRLKGMLTDRDIVVKVLAADILVLASPTWLGRPSSIAQRALERLDALISETDDAGRPVAYGRVAGFVVTGNEDGAHHVISELAGALIDIGFTVPGQAWTYWNRGPGPGASYLEDDAGRDWSHKTGRAVAANLAAVARALRAHPMPAPPS